MPSGSGPSRARWAGLEDVSKVLTNHRDPARPGARPCVLPLTQDGEVFLEQSRERGEQALALLGCR